MFVLSWIIVLFSPGTPFVFAMLHRYFSFLEECKDAKACTVLLRGGSKDVLNEVERNLGDAMQVYLSCSIARRLTVCSPCASLAVYEVDSNQPISRVWITFSSFAGEVSTMQN